MSILALSTRASDYFDLDPRTLINLTLINPIFDREAIDRVFTFPFKLPATPGNLAKVNHANRLDAKITTKYLEVILWIEGQPCWYGELAIGRTTSRDIEVNFKNDALRAAEKLEKKRLREVQHIEEVTTAYNPQILLAATWPFLAPIATMAISINEQLFQRPISELAGLISDINAVFPGLASDPGLPAGLNERWLFFENIPDPNNFRIILRPGVASPSTTAFFFVNATTADDEATRIGNAFDTMLGDGGTSKARYPVMKAPNVYGEAKNALYGGYINYIQGDTQEHPNDESAFLPDPQAWRHTLVPFPQLQPLIEAIAQSVGLTGIGGSFFADPEVQQLIQTHNYPIDLVVGDLNFVVDRDPDWVDNYRHTYQPVFNLASMLPDISAKEELSALANTFCLFFRVKQGRLLITAVRDLLRAAPEDWTAISEPYEDQEYPEYNGHSLDYNRQGDETNEPPQLQRVDGGSEAEEFIAAMYTFFERVEADQYLIDYTEDIPIRSWRVPFNPEAGRSTYFNLTNTPSIRLLFWRGLQPDSEGQDYPLATHGRYGFGTTPIGNYSLDWSGPGGLLETWWAEYIRLLTHGKPIRRRVRLTAAHLRDLAEWKSVVKKTVYDELGQTTAVIKSVNVKIGINKISPATVEFVTL